jgi:hypothetical protein
MKNLIRGTMGLLILLSAGSAFGAGLDPMWMFVDTLNTIFANFRICDTFRGNDYLCRALESDQFTDTGDSYDKSRYINFNYQFSSNPIIVRNEFDSSQIDYQDSPRPGYAGFKTAWDYGMTGFPLSRYTYFVFAHKGPNLNHKVTVKCWYNNGDCGAPSYKEDLGTFAASATWKVDTIVIPEAIKNKPDKERNFNKYFEFVFIINNLDPNDTTSGPPGALYLDNIRLTGCNPIDTSPKPLTVNEGQPSTFRVATSRVNTTDILTYQWKKGGVAIPGATSQDYTIPSVNTADAGTYTAAVTISSSGLTFTSQGATLTVNGGTTVSPQIVTQPQSITATAGKPATFTVVATGTPAPTYQWQRFNTPIPGATSSTYAIPAVQTSDAGNYNVVVTNSAGSITSGDVTLTVQAAEEKSGCGCGAGTGLALIPPFIIKAMTHRKRKKKTQ